jgi:predicted dehydrogenase
MLEADEVGESPGDLASRTGVHGAVIATPPESHAALAESYARAGKHVLVEKPFVVTPAAAKDVQGASEAGGGRVLVNHFWRYYPSVEIARELVEQGAVGEVRRVEAVHGGRWDWPAASDYATSNPYGGVVWDTGSHVLDTVLHILTLDDPARDLDLEIIESTRTPSDEPSHEFDASVRVTDDASDIQLRVTLSRVRSLACVIKLFGDGGTIVVPTTFADAALLRAGKGGFVEVRSQAIARAPKSLRSLFRLVHEELLRTIDGQVSSRLRAESFVVLTRFLASLTEGRR